MSAASPLDLAVIAGVVVIGAIVYKSSQAVGTAAAEAVNAVNPLNPDNIIGGAVNGGLGAVMTTGGPATAGVNADGSWTLGGWAYDMTHRDAVTGNYAWWPFDTSATTTPANTGGATGSW